MALYDYVLVTYLIIFYKYDLYCNVNNTFVKWIIFNKVLKLILFRWYLCWFSIRLMLNISFPWRKVHEKEAKSVNYNSDKHIRSILQSSSCLLSHIIHISTCSLGYYGKLSSHFIISTHTQYNRLNQKTNIQSIVSNKKITHQVMWSANQTLQNLQSNIFSPHRVKYVTPNKIAVLVLLQEASDWLASYIFLWLHDFLLSILILIICSIMND